MELIVFIVIGVVGFSVGVVFFEHKIHHFVVPFAIFLTWIGRMSIHEELEPPTHQEFLLGALVFLAGYFYAQIATDYWTDIAKAMLAAEAEED